MKYFYWSNCETSSNCVKDAHFTIVSNKLPRIFGFHKRILWIVYSSKMARLELWKNSERYEWLKRLLWSVGEMSIVLSRARNVKQRFRRDSKFTRRKKWAKQILMLYATFGIQILLFWTSWKMFCFISVLLDDFRTFFILTLEFFMTNSLMVEQMVFKLSCADYQRCLYLAKLYYRHLFYIWLMVIGW